MIGPIFFWIVLCTLFGIGLCGCAKKQAMKTVHQDLHIHPHTERLDRLIAAFPGEDMSDTQREAMGEFMNEHNKLWTYARRLKTELEFERENYGIDKEVFERERAEVEDELWKANIIKWVMLGVGLTVGVATGIFVVK